MEATLEDAVCLELPLNVVNVDRAIEAVGGSEEIVRVTSDATFAKEAEGLQLSLRQDRFHHAVSSAALPATNIVIEISVSQKYFEELGSNSGSSNSNSGNSSSSSRASSASSSSSSSSSSSRAAHDVRAALRRAAAEEDEGCASVAVTPKYRVRLLHRFREIADFQYYTGDSQFCGQLERSIFRGDLSEIQKLSLRSAPSPSDILPPPRFTVSTQPFYYGYKQSALVKIVDDDTGERRLVQTPYAAKVVSSILNWGDAVPAGPPLQLETNPKANLKQCIDELRALFARRPSYTRRSLQHKLGAIVARQLRYALPYVSYYYRSGPWRGAYIRYGCDPSKDPALAPYQVEHFRIQSDKEAVSKSGDERRAAGGEYVFDGTTYPDPPLLQLSDIADGFLEQYINTQELRTQVDSNDGWYTERVITIIRKVLRAELIALSEKKGPLPVQARKQIAEQQ